MVHLPHRLAIPPSGGIPAAPVLIAWHNPATLAASHAHGADLESWANDGGGDADWRLAKAAATPSDVPHVLHDVLNGHAVLDMHSDSGGASTPGTFAARPPYNNRWAIMLVHRWKGTAGGDLNQGGWLWKFDGTSRGESTIFSGDGVRVHGTGVTYTNWDPEPTWRMTFVRAALDGDVGLWWRGVKRHSTMPPVWDDDPAYFSVGMAAGVTYEGRGQHAESAIWSAADSADLPTYADVAAYVDARYGGLVPT